MAFSDDATDLVIYGSEERSGVTLLVAAGVLSILGVVSGSLYYIAFDRRTKTFHRTNVAPYLVSLLVANVLQAIGTIMNARWVHDSVVFNGGFCALQGAVKNAANVGTALWSFMIAVHVFNLLFLRWKTTRVGMIATLIGGWSAVGMIVTVGPLVIQTAERGPYFGVSGYWCWITDNYPREQTYMEYFLEFLSAGLGFILYVLVLLRVRGNLTKVNGRWHLRWIERSQAWQLSFARDMLDTAMLRVATNMVWYPVAYSLIIIPVALARLSSFTGHRVPFWATIITDVIFNLTGLVNAILFIYTRRILPDTAALPQFTTPRNDTMSDSETKFGVTPFSLEPVPSKQPGEFDKSKSDWDVVPLSPEVLPASIVTPRRVPEGRAGSQPANGDATHESGNASDVRPAHRDSYQYTDIITLPTLTFA